MKHVTSIKGIPALALMMVLTGGLIAAEKPKPVELIHADDGKNYVQNGQSIQELTGSVHIIQDILEVTCDKMIHYQDEGRLVFEGNVVFWDTIRTLKAQQVIYYQQTQRISASVNVIIIQDTLEIRCQKALYLDNQEEAYFDGGVTLTDQASGSTIEGRRGWYSELEGLSKIMGDPVFTEKDTTDSVRMQIFGMQIEYNTANHLAVSRDSVLVLRGDLKATGDLLEYNRDDGWAVLSGSPRIHRDKEVIRGDKISMFFESGEINRLLVNGNALATMPTDTLGGDRMNWMSGQTMDLTVKDGQLTQTVITGRSQALYYPMEEGERKGANRVSGDAITIWITNGEVSRIKVTGGTQGTYYPERLAQLANF